MKNRIFAIALVIVLMITELFGALAEGGQLTQSGSDQMNIELVEETASETDETEQNTEVSGTDSGEQEIGGGIIPDDEIIPDEENSVEDAAENAEETETENENEPVSEEISPEVAVTEETISSAEDGEETQAVVAETENAIDYEKSCVFSPAFEKGYAYISENAKLYEALNVYEEFATVQKGYVYAVSRPNAGVQNDKLKIYIACEDGVISAFAKAESLRPASEEEIDGFRRDCGSLPQEQVAYYGDDDRTPLRVLKIAYVETVTETADDATGTEEVEVAETDENPTETAQVEENNSKTADDEIVTVPAEDTAAVDNSDGNAEEEVQKAPRRMLAAATSEKPTAAFEIIGYEDILAKGQTVTVSVRALDEDCVSTGKNVEIRTDNDAVVVVNGVLLSAVGEGKANVRFISGDGYSETKIITVVAAPNGVSLDKSVLSVSVNGSEQLTASVSGGNSSMLSWYTSDANIAAVDENGLVFGVNAGTAVITARTYNGLEAVCAVSVLEEPGDIILSENEITLDEGTSGDITVSYSGDVLGYSNFAILSGDECIALEKTAENCFKISALMSGTAEVKFSTQNVTSGSVYEAVLSVNVAPAVSSIVFGCERVTVGVNEQLSLEPVAYDARGNVIESSFTYATSNKKYVAVNASGVIKGAAKGTSTITVKAPNGVSRAVSIKTVAAPTSVKVNPTTLKISCGESRTLAYTLSSGSAGAVKWTSENTDIATVDENGVVTAVKAGTVRIKVAAYNNKYALCTVTVYDAPTSVSFTSESYTVEENMKVSTAVAFSPSTANGTVEYRVEDEAIATVDANGVVTGVSYGTSYLYATVHSFVTGSDYFGRAEINVTPVVTSIEIGSDIRTIGVGEIIDLMPVAYDRLGNAAETKLTLTSSKKTNLKVSGTQIKGVYASTVTVKITAANGVNTSVKIKTVKAPTSVTLSASKLMLSVGENSTISYKLSSGSAGAVTWSSSNTDVAVVENGTVTAIGVGSATITCRTYNGKTKACTVTVAPAPIGIVFADEAPEASEGAVVLPTVSLVPADAYGKVVFSVSDYESESIAEVTDKGIQCILSGEVTLTATVKNFATGEDVTASVPLRINAAPARIELLCQRTVIGKGEIVDYEPVVYDARGNVIPAEIKTTFSNKYIASAGEGSVKGVNTGNCNVTFAVVGSSVKVTKKITVKAAPTSVKITCKSTSMAVGETQQLAASTYGNEKSKVNWISSDPAIVTVDENGMITAVGTGVAAIMATSYNGKNNIVSITVSKAPSAISFTQAEYSVREGEEVQIAVNMTPADSYGTVIYSISDTDDEFTLAEIDQNTGVVKGLYSGTATVKALVHDYEKDTDVTATAVVNVIPAPAVVEFECEATIGYGENVQLHPVAYDARGNVVETTFRITSGNAGVITVNNGDTLRGKANGKTAKITVKADNGVSLTKSVKVCTAPKSVSLNCSTLTMQNGDTAVLTAKLPSGQASAFSWSCSPNGIVILDDEGNLRAVSAGQTAVTVKTFNGKAATCLVTVKESPNGLVFEQETVKLTKEVSYTQTAGFESEAVWAKVTYTSSDEDVATVDAQTGAVKTVGEGNAVITASAHSNFTDETLTAEYTVVVVPYPTIADAGVESLTLGVGESVTLQPKAYNDEMEEIGCTYTVSTSNKSIASVSGSTVKGIKKGSATIKVTFAGGACATFKVTVVTAPGKVTVPKTLTLAEGQTEQIIPTLPSGTSGAVKFESENAEIAEVDEEGFITAHKAGTVRIKATTYNKKSALCTVTVYPTAQSLRFTESMYTVGENASVQVSVEALPAGSYSKLEYTITDIDGETRALVDDNGKVTGKLSGECVLTATGYDYSENKEIITRCIIHVDPAPVSIELLGVKSGIAKGEILNLNPIAYDARGNVINTAFLLSTASKAKIITSGTSIKGVNTGSTNITVKTANGVSKTVKITVAAAPKGVNIKESSLQMALTDTKALTVVMSGTQANGLDWLTSDATVAQIDENGIVTAVGVGTAKIAVYTCNKKTDYCTVTVLPEAESVFFTDDEIAVGEGGAVTALASVPEGTASLITYAVKNPFIAVVDAQSGRVNGIRQGTTVITATIHNTETNQYYTAECTVTVTPAPAVVLVEETRVNIGVGEVVDLKPFALDTLGNATGSEYTLKTSASKYIAVNNNGQIKGVKAGKATITITAYNGVKYTATYVCSAAPKSVTLNKTSITMGERGTDKLEWKLPSGTAGGCTLVSSDESVAIVDEDGTVHGVGEGNCSITCRTFNGKTAVCTVKVLLEPDAIEFVEKQYNLGEGAKAQLHVLFNENHYGTVTYESSDASIAQVDAETGIVTAVMEGNAVITCTTVNGITGESYSDTCDFTVTSAPVRVGLKNTRLTIGVNEVYLLEPVAYDAKGNETGSSFTVVSSSATYVAVNGLNIKGVRTGSAKIKVTAYNGVNTIYTIKVVAAPTAVKLGATSIPLVIGEGGYTPTVTLSAAAAVSNITWQSENPAIASVDAAGCITPVSVGTTRIKATTYNGKYALLTVKVYTEPEWVKLDKNSLTIGVNQKDSVEASINDGAYSVITYSVSPSGIVTVSSDGTITALGKTGTAVITAATANGKTDTCTVNVVPAPSSVAFTAATVTIGVGQVQDMNELVELPEGTAASLTFAVESTTRLNNLGGGRISGKSEGSTRVKVTTHNGKTALITVYIRKAPTSFKVLCDKSTVYENDTLTFTISAASNTAAEYTFTSSKPDVVAVNPDGTATALAAGTAVVTARSHNGVTASYSVEVYKHVASLSLAATELTLVRLQDITIECTVYPEDAHNKAITWSSSDESYVSVSNGLITALKATTEPITITAYSDDTGITATMLVNVKPIALQGIQLQETDVTLERGRTYTPEVVFSPATADNKTLLWTSDNPTVAKVSTDGVVTAMSDSGSATITCTSADGGFTASVVVEASKVHAQSVAIDEAFADMTHYDSRTLSYTLEPADADIASVSWTVSNPAVLVVSGQTTLTAQAVGNALLNVSVTDSFGNVFTDSIEVTVAPLHVSEVLLSESLLRVRAGKTADLNLTVNPINADDRSVVWTQDRNDLITVVPTENGVSITAGDTEGETRVAVMANDNGMTAQCIVEVVGMLAVEANTELDHITSGNDIVWTLNPENNIGDVTYSIIVEKDGVQVMTSSIYNTNTGVLIGDVSEGEYVITVQITDVDGDTASCTSTVTVSDSIEFTVDGIVFAYRVIIRDDEYEYCAAISLVSAPEGTQSITVPATADGLAVIRIDDEGFMNRTELVSVRLPASVSQIGARAFKGCTSLSSMTSY